MSRDPGVRVVARDLVVDQEGPVARLKEKRLPLERGEETRRNRVAPLFEPLDRELRRGDLLPVRDRVVVPPDLEVAAAAPCPGGHADSLRARRRERLARRPGHDTGPARELLEDGGEEVDALEPPMAEELEVEHRDDRGALAVRERRRALEEVDEVRRVGVQRLGDAGGLVGELVAEVEAGVRDAPVPVAARSALLVELEVPSVTRVPDLAGPDLLRRERVAGEDADASPVARTHDVETVGRRAPLGTLDDAAVRGLVPAALHEVRLDEEVTDAARGKEVLETAPLLDVPVRGRRPRSGRAVGTLGQPEPARGPPEMPRVRREADVELAVDRAVVREKRKEPVRRGRRDHLERALLGEPSKRRKEPALPRREVGAHLLVEPDPEVRDGDGAVVAERRELDAVLAGRGRALLEVAVECGAEARVRELLAEDGRHPDRRLERDAAVDETLGGSQERDVRFRGRLEEPVCAVRPRAVPENVREVPVQDEDERRRRSHQGRRFYAARGRLRPAQATTLRVMSLNGIARSSAWPPPRMTTMFCAGTFCQSPPSESGSEHTTVAAPSLPGSPMRQASPSQTNRLPCEPQRLAGIIGGVA